MKKRIYILGLLLILFACTYDKNAGEKEILLNVISNQQYSKPIDLAFLNKAWGNGVNNGELNIDVKALSGEEIMESIDFSGPSTINLKTKKAGIARYLLTFSKANKKKVAVNLTIVSAFLLDFTQNKPFEPGGSVNGIPYPNDSLVRVANEILCIDSLGNKITLSPGLLVNRRVTPVPHNSGQAFPAFDAPVKYYGYKENENAFYFRYQPLIPMLEVGNGDKNRGVGIIVINKDQFMDDPTLAYEFEGYCSIRTRSDEQETYNLGVVIGTVNEDKTSFKDAVVARDYFNIGYSSSGQIYSERFTLGKDDHLTVNIVGEAGLGGDKKRTTRFEYIKIVPSPLEKGELKGD